MELVIDGVALLLATGALVLAAVLHGRTDEQEARLDALERDAAPVDDIPVELPPEVEPPRAPIGFRRE